MDQLDEVSGLEVKLGIRSIYNLICFGKEVRELNAGDGMMLLDKLFSSDTVKDKAGTSLKNNFTNPKTGETETSFKEFFLTILNQTGEESNLVDLVDNAEIGDGEFHILENFQALDFLESLESLEDLEKLLDEMDLALEDLNLDLLESMLDILDLEPNLENVNLILDVFTQLEEELDFEAGEIFDKNFEEVQLLNELSQEEFLDEDEDLVQVTDSEVSEILTALGLEQNSENEEKLLQFFEKLDVADHLSEGDEIVAPITESEIIEILETLGLDQSSENEEKLLQFFEEVEEIFDLNKLLPELKQLMLEESTVEKIQEHLEGPENKLDLDSLIATKLQSLEEIAKELDLPELNQENIQEKLKDIMEILDVDQDLAGFQEMLNKVTHLEDHELEEMFAVDKGKNRDIIIALALTEDALNVQKEGDLNKVSLDNEAELSQNIKLLQRMLSGESLGQEDDINSQAKRFNSILNTLQENAAQNIYAEGNKNQNTKGNELSLLQTMLQTQADSETKNPHQLLQKLINSSGSNVASNALLLKSRESGNKNNLAAIFNHSYNKEGKPTEIENIGGRENQDNIMDRFNSRMNTVTRSNNFNSQNFDSLFKNSLSSTNNNQTTTTLNLENIFNQTEMEALKSELGSTDKASTRETNSFNLLNREAFVGRIAEEIMKFASLKRSDGTFTLNLRLKPEKLGNLRLQFTSEDGVMRGEITASSQQARQIIQANLSQLREQLEAQGYEFDSLDVATGEDTGFQSENTEDNKGDDDSKGKKSNRQIDPEPDLSEDEEILDSKAEGASEGLDYERIDYLV